MRNLIFFLFLISIFTSCQREPTDILPPDNTDSVSTSKLKSIHVVHSDPNDPIDVILAIQYDTPGRKLNVYLDDPATNTNIFDELLYSYEFNAAGYLTNVSAINFSQVVAPLYSIQRDGANQIQQLLEYDPSNPAGSPADITRKFSYTTIGGQLKVKDSFQMPLVPYYQSQEIIFNTNKAPVSIREFNIADERTLSFVYNGQNELTTIKGNDDTTTIVLDKSQTALDWNKQAEIFLGKDANLLSLLRPMYSLGLNFLTILLDDKFETEHNVLLSPPVQKISRQGLYNFGASYGKVDLNFTNTFLTDKKLSSITINGTGDGTAVTRFDFTYY
jgi:hypothetical protein